VDASFQLSGRAIAENRCCDMRGCLKRADQRWDVGKDGERIVGVDQLIGEFGIGRDSGVLQRIAQSEEGYGWKVFIAT
jgi:hypothetical protein